MSAQEFPSGVLDTSDPHSESDSSEPSLSRKVSFSRLNAQAPAFVPARPDLPRLAPPPPPPPGLLHHVYPPPPNPQFHMVVPVHNHRQQHRVPVLYSHNQRHYGGNGGSGFIEQDTVVQKADKYQNEQNHGPATVKNGPSDDTTQRIVNQVEYYFSDLNLATTDHLMRFITKDPDGYVPISVVASFKKIKAVMNSHSQLATILRNSSKLVVSDDGKRVRRQHPLSESNMEELQARIVVAENLPEDHCHQNLMKIFSAVGSVKTIRTCPPQTSNGGTSLTSRSAKADGTLFSNKLHAFVEYESVDLAEKAVEELNDEANWRSGLRVRLMPRCASKPAQAHGRKQDGEGKYEEDKASTSEQQTNEKQIEDPCQESDTRSYEPTVEEPLYDNDGGKRKQRNRGRGRARGRGQFQPNSRGNHPFGTPPNSFLKEQLPAPKQPPGPRMPDGTRGFSMGRGKPFSIA